MKYTNVNLDFYDDNGELLKQFFKTKDSIPEIVKTASLQNSNASDNDYALIMTEGGNVVKKFSTSDAGNTWLSSLYYSVNRDKLPEDAQKTAAYFIKEACVYYGIPVTDTIENDISTEVESNIVSVSGSELKPVIKEASERIYALGNKYPIDNLKDLNTAQEFFQENHKRMKPSHRREFAVKVASVSKVASVEPTNAIKNYSGDDYSPSLDGHLGSRYHHLTEISASEDYKNSLVKLARERNEMNPVQFAQKLEEFDLKSGLDKFWDNSLSDAWYSTFNIEKVGMGFTEAKASFKVGEFHVTEDELKLLSQDAQKIRSMFGEKFSNEFVKNPVEIFQSMPLPQKKVIAKMAIDAPGRF